MLYEKNPADPEAAKLMESARASFPSNPDLHLRLLDAYFQTRQDDKVPGLIKGCRKIAEADARFAFAVIYTLVRYESLEIAKAELEETSRKHGASPEAAGEVPFIRGLLAVSAHQKEQALSLFQEADRLKFPAENSLQMRMLAEALARMEEFKLSAQAYQVYLTHFPKDHEARFRLALSYLWAPALERAAEVFEEVLNQVPDLPQAHFYLGLALVELKKHDEAKQHFESELQKRPQSFETMAQLALLAYLQGDDETCMKWLEKASALKPEWVETQYVYGLLYNRQGKYDEAIGALERAVSQAPRNMKVRLQLSTAYLRSGNEAKATEHKKIYEALMESHKLKSLLDEARRK
jgi:tetratricopeptide (TPR) repeat protein